MDDTNYNISMSIFQSRRKPGRSSGHGLLNSQPVQPDTFQQIIVIFQQINHLLSFYQDKYFTNPHGAVWAVRWPCGILAIAVKTLSLRLFFPCSFRKETNI